MNVDYGDQRIAGQGVVFRGEPLVIDVGVVNQYDAAPVATEPDWAARIASHLTHGGRFETAARDPLALQCDMSSMRNSKVRPESGYLELEPRGSQFVRCRTRDADMARLPAGRYTVTVEWTPGSGRLALRELKGQVELPTLLNGVIEFELRDAIAAEDQLDRLNHLASHALLEGNFSLALQFAEEVLKLRASSVTALATRAQAHAARGSCSQAVADLEEVGAIIEANHDSGNLLLERGADDDRGAAAMKWRQQARTLKCR